MAHVKKLFRKRATQSENENPREPRVWGLGFRVWGLGFRVYGRSPSNKVEYAGLPR